MSDMVPGTEIELEIIRRFHHYNVGDKISVAPAPARELVAKRLARTTGIQKVPPVAAASTDGTPPPAVPQRQPGTVVRK